MTQATAPPVNDDKTGLPPENTNGVSAANPPKNPDYATLPDNHPVVVALNSHKQKNEVLSTELASMKQQLAMVTGYLGQIDPNSLNKVQSALKAQEQAEVREAEIRQAAIRETEDRYSQNVNNLTASLQDSQTQLQQIQRRTSLQGLFAQCGGLDFDSFNALLESRFVIDYGEPASPLAPPPIKGMFNKGDMSPVAAEDGRLLKPDEALMLLRQGKLGGAFGKIIKETFQPWNQATGNGYSPSLGAPGMPDTNPFTVKNWNVTAIGQLYKTDPAMAIRLANESGNPKAIAMAKSWTK